MQVRHIKSPSNGLCFIQHLDFTKALAINVYLNLAGGTCGGARDTISTTLLCGLADANCNPFLTTFNSISTPIHVSISL